MKSPLLLLLGTGLALGLNFPLGKLANSSDISAALWSAYICLAAGLTLGIVTAASQSISELPSGLGPVEIHRELMTAEQRWIIAEKH